MGSTKRSQQKRAKAARQQHQQQLKTTANATVVPTGARLDEESIFATRYVPQHLKLANQWNATVIFPVPQEHVHDPAKRGGQQHLLVPFDHPCRCEKKDGCTARVPRPMQSVPSDIYFAVGDKLDQHDDETNYTPIDETSTLDDYVSLWTSVLKSERQHLLRRYEQYSQYAVMVSVHQNNPRDNGPRQTFFQKASFTKQGIADTTPPLCTGDTVLVRATHRVSLPLPYNRLKEYDYLNPHDPWSPPLETFEIRSTVLHVQRGVKIDKVTIGWPAISVSSAVLQSLIAAQRFLDKAQPGYNVRFIPSSVRQERYLTALEWLRQSYAKNPSEAMEMLFPISAPSVACTANESKMYYDQARSKDLNDKQSRFVSMVLSRTKHPSTGKVRGAMILTGPAGVGKTKTMLATIYAVLQESVIANTTFRILVCTPSHTAADVVTQRLGQTLPRTQLFRLNSPERSIETVPIDIIGFCCQSNNNMGSFAIPKVSELLKYQVIVCTCSDAHLLYHIGLTNQQLRSQRRCLNNFMTKACKDTNIEHSFTGIEDPHFTHLFIDEAAQATEPETLVPLSVVVDPLAGNRKVEIALVGDPRQLSPIVYSPFAMKAGLGQSWMERLLLRPVSCLGGGREDMLGLEMIDMSDWLQYSFRQYGQELLSEFLTLNYRGHPSFLMMPSALFYSDKLQAVDQKEKQKEGNFYWCTLLRHVEAMSVPVETKDVHPNVPDDYKCKKQFDWPMHFRGVIGNDTSVTVDSGFASNSWCNREEAEVVAEMVLELSRSGISSDQIGVMSPFRGQVVLIRKLLREISLGGVNVGTIEDYQSVEHQVIILSLTRSTACFLENDKRNRVGVFGQQKRTNVAITRAEFMFLVVGNPNVCMLDVCWRQLLLFYFRNGLYYGARLEDQESLAWKDAHRVVNQTTYNSKPCKEENSSFIAISTLERLMRNHD